MTNEEYREKLMGYAREMGESLMKVYMPDVVKAQQRGDRDALARLHRQFNDDYRRSTAHIVGALASLPPAPLVIDAAD